MRKFTTIFTARTLIEAHLIKNVLELNGIEVKVLNENMATLYPHINAINLPIQVCEENTAKALEIIKKCEEESASD